jgi:hypothetical protein
MEMLLAILCFLVYSLKIHPCSILFYILLPSFLSLLQLFYFGTFLPHRELENGYKDSVGVKTTNLPLILSFITAITLDITKNITKIQIYLGGDSQLLTAKRMIKIDRSYLRENPWIIPAQGSAELLNGVNTCNEKAPTPAEVFCEIGAIISIYLPGARKSLSKSFHRGLSSLPCR